MCVRERESVSRLDRRASVGEERCFDLVKPRTEPSGPR